MGRFRRWGRWVPGQLAVVPALWLLFGAAPGALLVVGGRGRPTRGAAIREGPGVLASTVAAFPGHERVARSPGLWPDRVGRAYYPRAAVAVDLSGGSVSRVRDATD